MSNAERGAKYQREHPKRKLIYSARERAKRDGLEFDLDDKDFEIPARCPVLDIPLKHGRQHIRDDSPTLDRIDPRRGYTRDNVAVISARTNRLKNNGTREEMLRIARWIGQNLRSTPEA